MIETTQFLLSCERKDNGIIQSRAFAKLLAQGLLGALPLRR